jgi:hypothetical protein
VDRWEIRKMKVSLAGKVAIVTGETPGERPGVAIQTRAQTELSATKIKNGRYAEARRPFCIFVKWN